MPLTLNAGGGGIKPSPIASSSGMYGYCPSVVSIKDLQDDDKT